MLAEIGRQNQTAKHPKYAVYYNVSDTFCAPGAQRARPSDPARRVVYSFLMQMAPRVAPSRVLPFDSVIQTCARQGCLRAAAETVVALILGFFYESQDARFPLVSYTKRPLLTCCSRISQKSPNGEGRRKYAPADVLTAEHVNEFPQRAPDRRSAGCCECGCRASLDEYNVWCGHIRHVKPGSRFAQVDERRISSV
jgi:hypothetical protein